jgi:hypothetical protein
MQQAAARKINTAIGAFMDAPDSPTITPPIATRAKQRPTEREKSDNEKDMQIKAMHVIQADELRKKEAAAKAAAAEAAAAARAAAAAAEVIRKQQIATAKSSTGKENEVDASVNKQPPPEALGGEGREPLREVETHQNSNTSKGVAVVSARALVPFVEPSVSNTPSASNSASSGSGTLLPRTGTHGRPAALASNMLREELCGVAHELCANKTLNPIVPLKDQPKALNAFRTELLRQYPSNAETGSAIKNWLQVWLTSQRKQARHPRTKVVDGFNVQLAPKWQEELKAYKAEQEGKHNPVERHTACGAEGTGSGEPSFADGAPPTAALPVSHLLSEDTNTTTPDPRVLTKEEVHRYAVGDPVGLGVSDSKNNGKSKTTYSRFITTFAVRSFLLYCSPFPKRINTSQRTPCLLHAP